MPSLGYLQRIAAADVFGFLDEVQFARRLTRRLITNGVFAAGGLPVRFQGFQDIAYAQGREPFPPYIAFIDAVMKLGWTGTTQLIEAMRDRS